MKLITNIAPRKDGTVIYRDEAGRAHTFAPDGAGSLVCDVSDESLAVKMLLSDLFAPADEADYDAANALVEAEMAIQSTKTLSELDLDDDDDDDDGDDGDAPADMGALPLEAGTAPVARPRPPRANPQSKRNVASSGAAG